MAGLFFERKKKCLEDGSCDGQPCGKHNLLSRNCQHARSPRQQRGSGPEQYCDANLAKSTTRKAKIKTKETKKKSVTNSFLPRERERERERERVGAAQLIQGTVRQMLQLFLSVLGWQTTLMSKNVLYNYIH